jgi:hypothetical protein
VTQSLRHSMTRLAQKSSKEGAVKNLKKLKKNAGEKLEKSHGGRLDIFCSCTMAKRAAGIANASGIPAPYVCVCVCACVCVCVCVCV